MNKFVNQIDKVFKAEEKYKKQANDFKKTNAKLSKKLLPITLGKALIKENKVTYQGSRGKTHNRKIKSLADFNKHFKVVPKQAEKDSKYPITKFRKPAK